MSCIPVLNPNDGLTYCPDGEEPDCENCDPYDYDAHEREE